VTHLGNKQCGSDQEHAAHVWFPDGPFTNNVADCNGHAAPVNATPTLDPDGTIWTVTTLTPRGIE
jgi:hypothetical protein